MLRKYITPWNILVVIVLAAAVVAVFTVRDMEFFEQWSTDRFGLLFAVVVGLPLLLIFKINEMIYIRKVESSLKITDAEVRMYKVEKLLRAITVNVDDSRLPKKLIVPKSRLLKERAVYLMSKGKFSAALNDFDWIDLIMARMKPLETDSPHIDLREECMALCSIALSRLGEIIGAERKLEPLLARFPYLDSQERRIIQVAHDELTHAKRAKT